MDIMVTQEFRHLTAHDKKLVSFLLSNSAKVGEYIKSPKKWACLLEHDLTAHTGRVEINQNEWIPHHKKYEPRRYTASFKYSD
jgi:hypothetical protein